MEYFIFIFVVIAIICVIIKGVFFVKKKTQEDLPLIKLSFEISKKSYTYFGTDFDITRKTYSTSAFEVVDGFLKSRYSLWLSDYSNTWSKNLYARKSFNIILIANSYKLDLNVKFID